MYTCVIVQLISGVKQHPHDYPHKFLRISTCSRHVSVDPDHRPGGRGWWQSCTDGVGTRLNIVCASIDILHHPVYEKQKCCCRPVFVLATYVDEATALVTAVRNPFDCNYNMSCINISKESMNKLCHTITAVHKHVHVLRLSLASLQCCSCTGRQTSLSRCDVEHVARGVTWLVRRWVWWVLLYFLEVTVSGSN